MYRRIERSHRFVALGVAVTAVAISGISIAGIGAAPDAEHALLALSD